MNDDLISRQAAIEIIKNYCENGCDYAEDNWCPSCQREKFVELLKELPSAQPERRGRWIVRYECPNCGEERGYAFDVCPMCGADMRGEQE